MAKTVYVQDGQTLLDIACQELGGAEYVFDLCELNGLSDASMLPQGGMELVLPRLTEVQQARVAEQRKQGIRWQSPVALPPTEPVVPGGIGFMKITDPDNPDPDTDFIVS